MLKQMDGDDWQVEKMCYLCGMRSGARYLKSYVLRNVRTAERAGDIFMGMMSEGRPQHEEKAEFAGDCAVGVGVRMDFILNVCDCASVFERCHAEQNGVKVCARKMHAAADTVFRRKDGRVWRKHDPRQCAFTLTHPLHLQRTMKR